MKVELREAIEREILSWPGVSKETGGGSPGKGGFWVPPATVYRFGRRHLGHVHHNDEGLADFSFPREIRDGLIRTGRAIPHPAFPDSRTDASHELRDEEDLREVIDLFRLSYERAKEAAERRDARRRKDTPRGPTVARRHRMNRELLEAVEREVLAWPGVVGEAGRGVTVYRYGRRQIGHVHHDGVADLQFPREVHDALISSGRAEPHRGGFPAVVSYRLRSPEDVPGAVELFRMSYERTRAAVERRVERQG